MIAPDRIRHPRLAAIKKKSGIGWTVDEWCDEYYREQCMWASEVDGLNEEIDRYWREALRARAAWALAAFGWLVALALAAAMLWWRP